MSKSNKLKRRPSQEECFLLKSVVFWSSLAGRLGMEATAASFYRRTGQKGEKRRGVGKRDTDVDP